MGSAAYSGLEFLSSPVFLLDAKLRLVYANPMAEQLFELSLRNAIGLTLPQIFAETDDLVSIAGSALQQQSGFLEHALALKGLHGQAFQLSCTVTPIEAGEAALLLEFQQLNHKLKIAREERIQHEQQQNRQLIRSLAHEIRNPLGGIKGAAQLLERELERRDLHEYTQVIVKEADRLQALMDRLLAPQRIPLVGPVNIHEVLERVRSLILAENGSGITIERDYDSSLPELAGDREQLIQAVLNISRNAAQAMAGKGVIRLRTRVARQVTLHKQRYRLALSVQIIDNGPGIAPELQDKIFYPFVSGREDGHGLGLMLAQNYVSQHLGLIEFESEPGNTCFSLTLPILGSELLPRHGKATHETNLDH
jgi:two-component system, NtrC family, nitrogen regulation sensor histidine kinase GlnL